MEELKKNLLVLSKDNLIEKCKKNNIKGIEGKNKNLLVNLLLNNNKDITFIEVCAGCGGLSSGFIEAGLKPLLLNDIDKNCCETLKYNHINTNIICCPMDELILDEYIGKVDLLAGGIPCQSYSQAGKREGLNDDRGKLIYTFIDIIKKINPKIFLIENVKGLMTHNNGETIKEIINILSINNKYKIEYKLLNAVEYGVPQKRERIIIIGTLQELNINFKFPEKENNIIKLKDVLINVPQSECAKYNDEKKELFKCIPQGGCWINLPENL